MTSILELQLLKGTTARQAEQLQSLQNDFVEVQTDNVRLQDDNVRLQNENAKLRHDLRQAIETAARLRADAAISYRIASNAINSDITSIEQVHELTAKLDDAKGLAGTLQAVNMDLLGETTREVVQRWDPDPDVRGRETGLNPEELYAMTGAAFVMSQNLTNILNDV